VQERGIPQREIFRDLRNYFDLDLKCKSGKVLGSMVSKPQSFAKKIYSASFERELGLPEMYPGTIKIEKEAVEIITSLFSKSSAVGHIVSGGTEANIIALWVARNKARKERPEVIVSESSHFSLDKAADLLNLRLIKIGVDKNYKMKVSEAEDKINENTIAIVGTAGTSEFGVIDPIPELAKIATEKNIYLHVDAAFGGFVAPFLKELGYDIPDFDFKLNGVCSITADPHKVLRVPSPCGGIFFRDNSFFKAISQHPSYIPGYGIAQQTILGTRSAAPSIALWAILKSKGREGLKKEISHSMNLANFLYNETKKMKNIKPVIKPVMNIVNLNSEKATPEEIRGFLQEKKWQVFSFPNSIRIVITPYLTKFQVEELVSDLKELDKKLD